MKQIIDLHRFANSNWNAFIDSQMSIEADRRILFVSPQLSGRHLYQILFLCNKIFSIKQEDGTDVTMAFAITDLTKFDKENKFTVDFHIKKEYVQWATHIIVPFSTQSLATPIKLKNGQEISIYEQIRSHNPDEWDGEKLTKKGVQIGFYVDFNFYELAKTHLFYKTFHSHEAKEIIEDNMVAADFVLVNNMKLLDYLQAKFEKLFLQDRYKGMQPNYISCLPFLMDERIFKEKTYFDPNEERERYPSDIQMVDDFEEDLKEIKNEIENTENTNTKKQ